MKTKVAVLLGIFAAVFSGTSLATDGHFAHGYGVKSQGMGGVGIALPQDALAAAANPAGMGLVGDRADLGVTWLRAIRGAEITAPNPAAATYDGSDPKSFLIPEFGYNRVVNPDVTLGISVYGNGGMNTNYKNGIPLFLSAGRAGIDFAQLFIAPTATWKMTPRNIIGVSLNLAYQRFEAKGLQVLIPFSSAGGNLTNRGHDNAYGAGLHLGWIGQVNDAVTLGASYQTKTWMSKFGKYRGLFAEQGDVDVPATYGAGIAVKVTPQLTVAADVQRILYSGVGSISNLSLSNLFAGNALGSDNGSGFGWRNVTATKLGASYAWNESLTLRAGFNHATQALRKRDTLLDILAPAAMQDHLTMGATWVLPSKDELSFSYTHVFENKVKGSGSIPAVPFGSGESNLKMYQDIIGIAYGWKL